MIHGEFFHYSAGARAIARNPRVEVSFPPRAGSHQPHAQSGGVWQFVSALFARESAGEIFACAGFLLCWVDLVSALHCALGDRRPLDVLLPPGGSAGLPRYEGPALCSVEWCVSA